MSSKKKESEASSAKAKPNPIAMAFVRAKAKADAAKSPQQKKETIVLDDDDKSNADTQENVDRSATSAVCASKKTDSRASTPSKKGKFTSELTAEEVLALEPGTVVVARLGKYPPWPSRIARVNEVDEDTQAKKKDGEVLVHFFGDKTFAWLPTSSVLGTYEALSFLCEPSANASKADASGTNAAADDSQKKKKKKQKRAITKAMEAALQHAQEWLNGKHDWVTPATASASSDVEVVEAPPKPSKSSKQPKSASKKEAKKALKSDASEAGGHEAPVSTAVSHLGVPAGDHESAAECKERRRQFRLYIMRKLGLAAPDAASLAHFSNQYASGGSHVKASDGGDDDDGGDEQRKKKQGDKKPRRATTSFFFYCNEVRGKLRAQHRELKNTEITKLMGEQWKAMSDEERAPYVAMHEADKKRADTAIREFDAAHPDEAGAKKRRRDPNAPKGLRSAFMYYVSAMRDSVRKELPELPNKEITKELGRRWSAMSDAEKKVYNDMTEKDRVRYEEEMRVYREKHGSGVMVPVAGKKRAQSDGGGAEQDGAAPKRKKKKRNPLAPAQAHAAFHYYKLAKMDELKREKPRLHEKQCIKELSTRFKALDEAGRAPYEAKAADDKKRYETEVEAFKKAGNQLLLPIDDDDDGSHQADDGKTPKMKAPAAKSSALGDANATPKMKAPTKSGIKRSLHSSEKDSATVKAKKSKNISAGEKEKKRGDKAAAVTPGASASAPVGSTPASPGKASAYMLFLIEQKKLLKSKNPNISNSDVYATVRKRWEALDDSARQVYDDKAKAS